MYFVTNHFGYNLDQNRLKYNENCLCDIKYLYRIYKELIESGQLYFLNKVSIIIKSSVLHLPVHKYGHDLHEINACSSLYIY